MLKLKVKSAGRWFKSEGKTFEEAVDNLKISGGAKGMCVVEVEQGEQKTSKILNGRYTMGLFGQRSPTMKQIYLKQAKALLGL